MVSLHRFYQGWGSALTCTNGVYTGQSLVGPLFHPLACSMEQQLFGYKEVAKCQ